MLTIAAAPTTIDCVFFIRIFQIFPCRVLRGSCFARLSEDSRVKKQLLRTTPPATLPASHARLASHAGAKIAAFLALAQRVLQHMEPWRRFSLVATTHLGQCKKLNRSL